MSDAKVTFLAMVPLVHHLLFNPEMFLADLKDMAAGKPPPEDYIRPDTSGFDEPDPADPARPRDAGTSAPKSLPLPSACVSGISVCAVLRRSALQSNPWPPQLRSASWTTLTVFSTATNSRSWTAPKRRSLCSWYKTPSRTTGKSWYSYVRPCPLCARLPDLTVPPLSAAHLSRAAG